MRKRRRFAAKTILYAHPPRSPGAGFLFSPLKLPQSTPDSFRSRCLTFGIVALCASCFSSKGVFVKSAYQLGADPNTLLGLRMLFATPFFLLGGWIGHDRRNPPLQRRDWVHMIGLGFLGYYLSSYVNFLGLQYLSAGLERIVLYTYPSLVVIGGAIAQRALPQKKTLAAAGLSYFGICIAFAGEATHPAGSPRETLLGVGFVFLSAVTYAGFILLGGATVKRIGSTRFTSIVTGISCGMILTHFAITRPVAALLNQTPAIYGWAGLLAIVGTVIPSYLLGIGLRRAGSQKFAVVASVGPIVTLVLAWMLLGETVGTFQAIGFALTLSGGLWISLQRSHG